ncbi:protein PFC0760c isoform X2 [Drosophila gunungcola]|uniref:protein PFC0760c isoform X2 n=1 Tax=Drosophila gunungcola TaxID=103775 RepID=UPI0022E4154F|nr:protein PFC0760c isoform X2 [Drosophila gunungcola]
MSTKFLTICVVSVGRIHFQIKCLIKSLAKNASDLDDAEDGLDDQFGGHDHGTDDESGSDSYTDEEYNSEYTNDDGNNSETSHYSLDIYDPWGSEDEVDANYSREIQF